MVIFITLPLPSEISLIFVLIILLISFSSFFKLVENLFVIKISCFPTKNTKKRTVKTTINPDKEIELQGGFKEFFIYGSLEDMEELIGNLIENACKWGREKVKISFEKRSKNEVKILIEDDGPGLKQEQKNKVFARGFRVD